MRVWFPSLGRSARRARPARVVRSKTHSKTQPLLLARFGHLRLQLLGEVGDHDDLERLKLRLVQDGHETLAINGGRVGR